MSNNTHAQIILRACTQVADAADGSPLTLSHLATLLTACGADARVADALRELLATAERTATVVDLTDKMRREVPATPRTQEGLIRALAATLPERR